MALAPKFAGQRLAAGSAIQAVHTLELYLDYVCPFSKKMFNTIYNDVFPLVSKSYPNKLQFIFRQQIQPWHPSSTLVHEAGVAVLHLAPDKFYPFSAAVFDRQTDFFDVNVVNEGRNDTYTRLAKIAGSVGVNEEDFLGEVRVSEKEGEGGALNVGNKTTDDLKLMVKANRLVGVHVTPTLLFNGVQENSISSGTTKDEWAEWLKKNIT